MPSDRGRRILMVARWAPPAYSGAGRQALGLARELAANGHHITFFTSSCGEARREHQLICGVEVVRWRAASSRVRIEKALFLAGLAGHLLSRPRTYDVVHLHGSYFVLRLLRLLKRPLGYAIVYKPTMVARDDPDAIAAVRPGLLRCVDRWICVASWSSESGLRAGIPGEKLVSLPNGVDLARFAPLPDADRAALRAEVRLPERPVWAMVASMIPRKRIHLAVEAWALLDRPRPLLVVVGPLGSDSPYVAEVLRLVELAGLKDDIRFLDYQENVERVLHVADAFVFTSGREGLPNAILEALAAGLPIVTTDFEAVEDVRALADGRMRSVDADPGALADAVAATSYDRVVPATLARISLSTVAAQYDAVYDLGHANGLRPSEPARA
jgi:glycosyltransferase involved in cell wall biosynthesis